MMFLKVTQYYVADLGVKPGLKLTPAPKQYAEGRVRDASAQRGIAGLYVIVPTNENP